MLLFHGDNAIFPRGACQYFNGLSERASFFFSFFTKYNWDQNNAVPCPFPTIVPFIFTNRIACELLFIKFYFCFESLCIKIPLVCPAAPVKALRIMAPAYLKSQCVGTDTSQLSYKGALWIMSQMNSIIKEHTSRSICLMCLGGQEERILILSFLNLWK